MRTEELLCHREFLRRIATGLLRGEADAEDIVQDAYVKALQKRPHSPGPWLARVVRRLAFRKLRENQRRGRREHTAARRPEDSDAADAAARLELERKLVEAVLALPEPYRTTVVQRYFEDLSAREIAARTNTPLPTVRTRLARALKRLREKLEETASDWRLALLPLALPARHAARAGTFALSAKKAAVLVSLCVFGVAVAFFGHAILEPATPPLHRSARTAALDARAGNPKAPGRPIQGSGAAGEESLTARVVGPNGAPAAGATVSLTGRQSAQTISGSDGAVHIEHLHPGYYDLLVRKGDATGARTFRLQRSRDLGRIQLEATVPVQGRVLDEKGRPLPGATVEVIRAPECNVLQLASVMGTLWQPNDVVARAPADGSGAYEIRVPEGVRVFMTASAKGHAQQFETARTYDGPVRDLEFRLGAGLPILGRIVDEEGRPVAGALVLCHGDNAMPGRAPKAETTSGADGSFALRASESWDLYVLAPGYARVAPGGSQPILPGRPVVVTLRKGISVRLRTVDASHPAEPAPGVNVLLVHDGGFEQGETDGRGEVVFRHVPTRPGGSLPKSMLLFWGGAFLPAHVEETERKPANGSGDHGDVPLSRGGVVSGRITNARTGAPVPGAIVMAFGGDSGLTKQGLVQGFSGRDGRYEIRGVPLKATSLLALHPDYALDKDSLERFVKTGSWGDGGPLFPSGARTAKRDLRLEPGAPITGVVVGPDDRPVAGATVKMPESFDIGYLVALGRETTAVTNARGEFRILGFAPGEDIPLVATRRGLGSSASVDAQPGGPPLTLRLRPTDGGGELSGRVLDEEGKPIFGVQVSVSVQSKSASSPGSIAYVEDPGATTTTDEKGAFRIPHVHGTSGDIDFSCEGYVRGNKDFKLGTGPTDLGTVVLKKAFSIEGIAVDEKGKPLGGVGVQASGGGGCSSQAAGIDGTFTFDGLEKGAYTLSGEAKGRYTPPVQAKTGARNVRIVFEKAGHLEGCVLGDGGPIANAQVEAYLGKKSDPQRLASAETDARGMFRLEGLPLKTPFRVRIRTDAYLEKTIENVEATDAVQQYVLESGAQVGGIVVDPEGSPVAGAEVDVMVHAAGGSYGSKTAKTGEDGRFLFQGLMSGSIEVWLEPDDANYVCASKDDVRPGQMNLRFVAEKGVTISGTVLLPDGTPARYPSVSAIGARGKWLGTSSSDEHGHFTVQGIRAGVYTVRAWLNGVGAASIPKVQTGTTGLEIHLPEK